MLDLLLDGINMKVSELLNKLLDEVSGNSGVAISTTTTTTTTTTACFPARPSPLNPLNVLQVGFRAYLEKSDEEQAKDRLNNLDELVKAATKVDDKGGVCG